MANGRSSVVLERRTRRTEAEGFMRSEHIIGKSVKNMEGYDLGEIASMWVGLLRGRVEYVVLAYGGGGGRKLFAVPIEALAYRPGDDSFLVNIDKNVLDAEEGFPVNDWPREANWDLIASDRPVIPPTREEALAVESTEAPPPVITTTERVIVSERLTPVGKVVVDQQVEVTAGDWTSTGASETSVAGEEETSAGVTVTEEPRGARTVVEQERPGGPLHLQQKRGAGTETSTRYIGAPEFLVYLEGTEYPAGKHDLISRAKTNNAPGDMIEVLDTFETKNYSSVEDVRNEFNRVT